MIKKSISNGLLLTFLLLIGVEIIIPGFISNWLPLSAALITLLILVLVLRAGEALRERAFATLLAILILLSSFTIFWDDLGFYGFAVAILVSVVITKNSFLDNK